MYVYVARVFTFHWDKWLPSFGVAISHFFPEYRKRENEFSSGLEKKDTIIYGMEK